MTSDTTQHAPFRIGILQCDAVASDLQPQFGDYPDMFRRLLGSDGPATAFATYDLTRGEFPSSIDECDAWLFTGSAWSAYDTDDWIVQAHDLVRALDAARRPTVGVCFGHQLVARALGGEVVKAHSGWGVGVQTTRLLEQRPWMTPVRDALPLLVTHQDQVRRPPEGATVLAERDTCPYDMLQIGEHVLTFQGHPEFVPGYVGALIERRRELIGEPTAQQGLASLSQPTAGDIAREWIHNFLHKAAVER